MVYFPDIKYILLDIEGTITSISFVRDVLFPYIKEGLKTFIAEEWQGSRVASIIGDLQKQSEADGKENVESTNIIPKLGMEPTEDEISVYQKSIVNYVLWQMSLDKKTPALKQLQGLMWATAYANKEFVGHLFEDVPDILKKWKESKQIYVYSSGSIEAQKLLFSYSAYGNLSNLIDGHFDTTIGLKSDSSSYQEILKRIGCSSDNVLFLTDVPQEAYAAETMGIAACLVSREGNDPLPETARRHFSCISSFSELSL